MNGIEIRNASPVDSVAMAALFLDRYPETLSGVDPNYVAKRLEWWELNSAEYTNKAIEDATRYPDEATALVAIDSATGVMVGFARAVTSQDQEAAHWLGITMARSHQGRGIASELERRRQTWATRIGRPALVEVVAGNDRALRFFERHGFVRAGLIKRPNLPFVLHNLQLQRNVVHDGLAPGARF